MGTDMGFRGQQIEDYGSKKATLSLLRAGSQNSCLGCQIGLVHEIALQERERLRDFLPASFERK